MNEINPSKYTKMINGNVKKGNNNVMKEYLVNLFLRFLIVVIILFLLAIVYKSDSSLKGIISNCFFEDNISFIKIKKVYDEYLGGLLPLKKEESDTTEVFNEKLNYSASSIFCDGVKLTVAESYLVPSLSEGMVVFIGDKENYGKTIIVENLDGVDYWYGNIMDTSLKLYDYVEKGNLVGEVKKDLYIVVSKDGKYLDYEEYIN